MKALRTTVAVLAVASLAMLVPETAAAQDEVLSPAAPVPETADAQLTADARLDEFDWECLECKSHDNGDGTWDINFGGPCEEGGGATFASTTSTRAGGGGGFDSCLECEPEDPEVETCEGTWGEFESDYCNELDCLETAPDATEKLLKAVEEENLEGLVEVSTADPETVRWDAELGVLQTLTCADRVWAEIPVPPAMVSRVEAALGSK